MIRLVEGSNPSVPIFPLKQMLLEGPQKGMIFESFRAHFDRHRERASALVTCTATHAVRCKWAIWFFKPNLTSILVFRKHFMSLTPCGLRVLRNFRVLFIDHPCDQCTPGAP
jgi:hypothetical protein